MFIGLDLGTTNVKALLVGPRGRVTARGSAPVSLRHVSGDGVEQDIEDIWRATIKALRQVSSRIGMKRVHGLGVSAQGGAIQLMDRKGRPMGPVISWLDGRGRPYDARLMRRLGANWFARHTGHGDSAITIGQLLRLRREDPDLLRNMGRVGYVGDVIVERLCGRPAHDATSLSIAMLYNPSLRTADPELLKMLHLTTRQLPDLVSPRQTAGGLRAEAARETGLPAGLPVSAAIHDQYAAALGAGVVRPAEVMFGAGTAWVFVATTDRLGPPVIPSAFICAHVVEEMYGQMLSMANGGSSFKWAAGLLGLGHASSSQIDALLASSPAGSAGVRFWPLLVGGGAGLAPNVPGRLAGLRLAHTRSNLLRAVVEGLALELARYLRLMKHGGIRTRRVVMCGGAASSRVTPQIIADATGLPVACATESEMSAFGAAVLARGIVDAGRPLADIAQEMVRPTRNVSTGPDARLYAGMLEEYIESLGRAGRE
jgi:sugar (pentulose or hexulose) kinase